MAIFKVTEDFDIDIAELDADAFNINKNITTVDNISTMQTAGKYYQQNQDIKNLLDLYVRLLEKEVRDLEQMAKDTRELDQTLVVKITG